MLALNYNDINNNIKSELFFFHCSICELLREKCISVSSLYGLLDINFSMLSLPKISSKQFLKKKQNNLVRY